MKHPIPVITFPNQNAGPEVRLLHFHDLNVDKDPDHNRRQPTRDADFIREMSNVKKPLWTPAQTLQPLSISRGEKHQGHAARSRYYHAQDNYKPASRELAGTLFSQSGLDEDEPACWNRIECLSLPVDDYFEGP